MTTTPASITASIPKNDAGTLFAATFLVIAAVKTAEKIAKLLRRPKKHVSKGGIVWIGPNGEKFSKIVASGPEGANDAAPRDPPESIWQITRVMEKRAMKEAREREFFFKAKLAISRTVYKADGVDPDNVSIHDEDDAPQQQQVLPMQPPRGPVGFPGGPMVF